jgi:hypothetical protein
LKDEQKALAENPAVPPEPAAEPLRILVVEDNHDAADSTAPACLVVRCSWKVACCLAAVRRTARFCEPRLKPF